MHGHLPTGLRPNGPISPEGSKLTASALYLHDTRPDRSNRYRTVKPGEPFYQLAAGFFHLQDDLPELERRVLLQAIAELWPPAGRRSGRGHSEYRADVVLFFHRLGLPVEVLAEAWGYTGRQVRSWLARAKGRLDTQQEVRIKADVPNAVPTFDALARAALESEAAERHDVLKPGHRLVARPPAWFVNDSPAEEVRLLIRRSTGEIIRAFNVEAGTRYTAHLTPVVGRIREQSSPSRPAGARLGRDIREA